MANPSFGTMVSLNLYSISAAIFAALLFVNLVRAQPNFIVVQPDDFYFFEEWGPPGQFDGVNSLEQFPPNSRLPNINRLWRGGVQMKSAYAAASMCGTSRYSTITGRYPSRSAYGRARDRNNVIRDVRIPATKLEDSDGVPDSKDCSENNIAALLQGHGYKTGVAGKWHLTSDDGGTYTYDRIRKDIRGCGFDFAEAIYKENLWGDWYGDATHNMEHVTAEAFKFIEEAVEEEGKPFFLYFNPTIPHNSGDVTDALEHADCRDTVAGRLEDSPFIRYGMTADYGGDCSAYRQSVLERGGSWDDKLAGAVWVDDAIGSLFQLLENLGIVDNTFFLFQLDHGENRKGSLFEGGTRIPQFVHYPDLFPAGSTFEGLVSTIDVAATIADIAGVAKSERYAMDGKSWKSEVVNGNSYWSRGNDRCLFFEQDTDRAVRCGCHKYMLVEDPLNRKSFTVREARKVDVSVSNDNYYDLCDVSGAYINAPYDSPERNSAGLTSFLKSELMDKIDCHLSRTNPSNDPIYDQDCDSALSGFGGKPLTAIIISDCTKQSTICIFFAHLAFLFTILSSMRPSIIAPTWAPSALPSEKEETVNPWADTDPWADTEQTSSPTLTPSLRTTIPTPQPSREPTKQPIIKPLPISGYIVSPSLDTSGRLENSNTEEYLDEVDDLNITALDDLLINENRWNPLFISRHGIVICMDNTDYLYDEIDGRDCEWVIKNDHCDREDPDTGLHVGKYFCPRSCSYCEADDKCADNPKYQWYGREGYRCDWLASSGRCDSERDAAGDSSVHLGKRYCPKSCGYCQEKHDIIPLELEVDVDLLEQNGPF